MVSGLGRFFLDKRKRRVKRERDHFTLSHDVRSALLRKTIKIYMTKIPHVTRFSRHFPQLVKNWMVLQKFL